MKGGKNKQQQPQQKLGGSGRVKDAHKKAYLNSDKKLSPEEHFHMIYSSEESSMLCQIDMNLEVVNFHHSNPNYKPIVISVTAPSFKSALKIKHKW